MQQFRKEWIESSNKKKGEYIIRLIFTVLLGIAGIVWAIKFAISVNHEESNYVFAGVAIIVMFALILQIILKKRQN